MQWTLVHFLQETGQQIPHNTRFDYIMTKQTLINFYYTLQLFYAL